MFGADFVFSSGTLFIAKCALPHEQSVAGALFSVMTQVWIKITPPFPLSSYLGSLRCRGSARMTSLSDGSTGHELMSIDEAAPGQFTRCWLITFLVWFRPVLIPRSHWHSNTSQEKEANSFWAAGNRIRAGDNDDHLQLQFGEPFSIARGGFGRGRASRGTTGCTADRVSRCELGRLRVWYLG